MSARWLLEELKQYVTDDEKLGALLPADAVSWPSQEAIAASSASYDLDKDRRVTLMATAPCARLAEGMGKWRGEREPPARACGSQYNTLLGGELAQFAYEPTGYCKRSRVDLV